MSGGTLRIHVETPGQPPREVLADHGQTITVGRDLSCSIVIDLPSVSRVHATLVLRDGSLHLQDSSSNGTVVFGKLVKDEQLILEQSRPIEIGGSVLIPKWDMASEETSTRDHDVIKSEESRDDVALRKEIHRRLLSYLDLVHLDRKEMDSASMHAKVRDALGHIIGEMKDRIDAGTDRAKLIHDLCNEALGLGPLEELLNDDEVSEVMVVDPQTIFIERGGRIVKTDLRFTDDSSVRAVIERIVTPLGRRIDESTPLVDARLKDGSRVNAVIRPLAIRGACITIRKFPKHTMSISDLVRFESMTDRMALFLERAVKVRKNVVISGGTGSGKTTLLNVLSSAIPSHERVITIEDAAELRLQQPHVVSLETRPPNMEGKGEYSIRDLVKNALRMRPDRIVVGECRGGEALDMLQAMNTGHEGSMTTTHANSPREALARIETLALMSGLDLPARAIRENIATSVDLILQQTRFSDGSRRITHISEVVGIEEGEIELQDIFVFKRGRNDGNERVCGSFRATGYLPTFLDQFISHGLVTKGDYL